MIRTAMPKLPVEIAEPTELVQSLWWTGRCKENYKKLTPELKKLFSDLVVSIANLDFKKENGHHDVPLKGYGKALEAHLRPNVSASADEVRFGIKRKGKDIFIYEVKHFSNGITELQILNVGDHSILYEDYKDIIK